MVLLTFSVTGSELAQKAGRLCTPVRDHPIRFTVEKSHPLFGRESFCFPSFSLCLAGALMTGLLFSSDVSFSAFPHVLKTSIPAPVSFWYCLLYHSNKHPGPQYQIETAGGIQLSSVKTSIVGIYRLYSVNQPNNALKNLFYLSRSSREPDHTISNKKIFLVRKTELHV